MLKRILVVGLGSIGKRHARLAKELFPSATVIVLRRDDSNTPSDLAIDHCVTSLEDALKFRPQAAVIANPASCHIEVASCLAKSGVHLLIEKPIASSEAGVADLIDLCQAQGVILMVAYNLRFMSSLNKFRELIAGECIGRVLSIRSEIGQYLPSWRPGSDYRKTVSAQSKLGGGVLLELSHDIDYLQWIFGEIKWVSAVTRKLSDLEIDVEDTAHLVFGFSSVQDERQMIGSLDMDFIRHDVTRTCRVIGELGTLKWDALAGTIELYERGGTCWRTLFSEPPQRDDSYLAEWRHFVECIFKGHSPIIPGQDGLAVLEVIEAARLSSFATGATVYVDNADSPQ